MRKAFWPLAALVVIIFAVLSYLLRQESREDRSGSREDQRADLSDAGANISEWDNSRIFSFALGSSFDLRLDRGKYPEGDLGVRPEGIVRRSALPAEAPFYAVRFETMKTGTATIASGDFSVSIQVYDPASGRPAYQDGNYGFRFTYPPYAILNPDFSFPELTANPLVRADLPRNGFEGTNLAEAGIIIGASRDKKILDACLKPFEAEKEVPGEILNGVEYKVFEAVGAAAGNRYETRSYRSISDGICYGALLLIHSGNIGNYPVGTVSEFDRAKALSELEGMARTLEIGR